MQPEPAKPAPMLRLHDIGRAWSGRPALQHIDLSLQAGERVALIGPSGGGKSTLIKLMAGALRPSQGRIEVQGRTMGDFSWRELQAFRARCRVVEQHSLLVAQSTVHRNVVSGLLSGWSWPRSVAGRRRRRSSSKPATRRATCARSCTRQPGRCARPMSWCAM
ncbi:MAG: ATP-binding cassette domain-containing protein [Aquabacterium commune]|uniref:ATP-binding cassette domain-containing protein n=1 Tax=Aquabacterium commune TaxID=70586 RepID=UPI003BB16883